LGPLDALEGERPGSGNGFGMIGHLPTPLTEQVGSVVLIELLALGQATARLFYVGSCLVERQGQSSQLAGDRLCDLSVHGAGLIQRSGWGE
jgi:hypothetical protein